jgi:hypothetical protein
MSANILWPEQDIWLSAKARGEEENNYEVTVQNGCRLGVIRVIALL